MNDAFAELRRGVKHVAEQALLAGGAAALARRWHRRRTLVLAFHNVAPAGASRPGDVSLHLPRDAFARQLDALARTHDVIPLADIDRPPRGDRPSAVVTFDDAYRGAMTFGLAEVCERRMPATVFIAPGLFGSTTWWDRLATASGSVPPAVRDAALTTHQGCADRVFDAFGAGTAALPAWAEIATEAEVREAATKDGITFGSHSWSHCNLAALAPESLAGELERPKTWLGTVTNAIPWLAYPYGLASDAVARAAAAAGYAGALRVEGGWLPGDAAARDRARFQLPRVNIPSGISEAGFRLLASGVRQD